MADYNLQGDSLVQGKNCIVRAGADAASAKTIGLVQDFEMRAQFQTQKAEVLGEFLPVAIDITGVSVALHLAVLFRQKDSVLTTIIALRNSTRTLIQSLRKRKRLRFRILNFTTKRQRQLSPLQLGLS